MGGSSSFDGVPAPVQRTGFQIEADCAIQSSGFLPQSWSVTRPSGLAATVGSETGPGLVAARPRGPGRGDRHR